MPLVDSNFKQWHKVFFLLLLKSEVNNINWGYLWVLLNALRKCLRQEVSYYSLIKMVYGWSINYFSLRYNSMYLVLRLFWFDKKNK